MSGTDDAYARGADARLAGMSESANPYDPEENFDDFCSWNDGWGSLDDDEDDADG